MKRANGASIQGKHGLLYRFGFVHVVMVSVSTVVHSFSGGKKSEWRFVNYFSSWNDGRK